MKKFTLRQETFEFNPTKYESAQDAFFDYDDHNDKIIGFFDTIEEAREKLKEIRVMTYRYSYKVAQATVAFIEEGEYEYDDEGELCFIEGSDIWDFTFEKTPNN